MSRVLVADLVLLLLNILWGYCFVLIKQLLVEITPFYLLALRFLIAGLILLPFQIKNLKTMSQRELRYFGLCGLALGVGFILQTQGMITTNPGKSGVITGTLVVFVPFIHYLWTRTRLAMHVILGTFLTFIGLYFISLDGGNDFTSVNRGDLFLLAGAIVYAIHVVVVDRTLCSVAETKPILLAEMQLLIVGGLSLIPALSFEKFPTSFSLFAVFGISFLAILGSLLAYIIQMWAQKFSPAPHVGVILSTEAVFACVFSYFIFNEVFTLFMWIGAILVLAGILITRGIFSFRRNHVTKII
jgi:drug/metabolite transporter (DMT)-like permease